MKLEIQGDRLKIDRVLCLTQKVMCTMCEVDRPNSLEKMSRNQMHGQMDTQTDRWMKRLMDGQKVGLMHTTICSGQHSHTHKTKVNRATPPLSHQTAHKTWEPHFTFLVTFQPNFIICSCYSSSHQPILHAQYVGSGVGRWEINDMDN